jgi:mRNA interferase RelE/StbE
MNYGIVFSDLADSQLKQLNKDTQIRVIKRLRRMSENPFLFVRRLAGIEFYSLRIGNYRVILKIETNQQIMLIARMGHSRDVYK